MSHFKVLVTDYEYETFAPEKEVLDKLGLELTFAQCRTEDDVIEAARDADALINQYAPISRRVIESLEKCKVISRYGVGFNTIDIEAATEKGIIVGNVTDYCLDEVSDHAMALILSCARKVTLMNNEVKKGNWNFNVAVPIFRLRGRTLGLVGFGNIPQTVAKKAQAFGLDVIAFDPYVPEEVAKQANVELVTLDELCERSDFISVHAPLNQHTQGMISHEQFNKMKKEAFIINTARGPVIDEAALIAALQEGKIAGAGLDVVEVEPIEATNPLLQMDNVILNPHSAFYSVEAETELKRKTAENVADVLSGYYPTYLVNRDVKVKVSLKDKE
ncbi:C-terminal binding protein [Bacillus luteolus]|uniref:C-terminal binding protein n=1 Tax=Litchfieldia luteola TaxID=682179 RepID=A0ABR9QEF7_9BACI|nr:C-terminal binding protein [Cytobacillus luteolus]MBE4906872.1 C-terminal binding protein [Cytobacillus luteolus]MBP1940473.1 D-3-phosphoglycerate dehydrogenase [Cytobacillus luteolus]